MKCPCKECPIIPMCRYKTFLRLYRECSLLQEYEPDFLSAFLEMECPTIMAVYKSLNPTNWNWPPKRIKANPDYYENGGGKVLI